MLELREEMAKQWEEMKQELVETGKELEKKNHRNKTKLKGAQIKSNRRCKVIKTEKKLTSLEVEKNQKENEKETGKGNPTHC